MDDPFMAPPRPSPVPPRPAKPAPLLEPAPLPPPATPAARADKMLGGMLPPPPVEPASAPLPSLTEQQMTAMRAAFEAVLIRTGSIVPPAPSSSIRVAAKKTATATKIGMLVLAGFSIAAEFVAAHYPHVIGPLGSLFKIALRLLGEAPSP